VSKALILGSTGMLGSAVERQLTSSAFEVLTASRTSGIRFDASELESAKLLQDADLGKGDWVINCVGLTKSRIDETSIESRSNAVRLNFDFPTDLATAAGKKEVKVIQVATDCVFSGKAGRYNEDSLHDAEDIYGKTKSLGEVPASNLMHLRCSLIGPEQGRNSLFFEWVRQQEQGASVSGYTNHLWNGLTSDAFGKIVGGLITNDLFRAGVQHLVPADTVTKDELVRLELKALGRKDVGVTSVEAPTSIDRTLTTNNAGLNTDLFMAAGFKELPTISEMVEQTCHELTN